LLEPTPRAGTGGAIPAARARLKEAASMPDISTAVEPEISAGIVCFVREMSE
jgi:hypothetical protein